ncbi:glucose-1-phosphate adenylyltransferase [Leadbettera azotonutricia]|uniref:Glucose-1-phosphate adenylyltransferase n=1 Tax=Leadbettera azotonutricia (strain ATCC BAA-888 / DSM 13862 / ZAS-9) TaxID=545695 RepID=F5YA72_LEAAZ|nr:glucose-1-phosphate adenylyltransferase [Leadbettera azotonutricia]AEF82854.1 glucose-1-phosphate adenylyltransferase [Leadbettera azotonutricia ZAS-9]
MSEVLSIVLGGGKGTRLFPLTQERAKPAVPFGGKYRLVDIPISNCINADLRQIYILTQFNSASLHLHLSQTYNFDTFSKGFVEILAAEQTFEHTGWFEGTADAVRKNFVHFRTQNPSYYLILSGDQLYRMNLKDFLQKHKDSGADITIACTTVSREDASQLGILKADKNNIITEFLEKPGPTKDISDFRAPSELKKNKAKGGEFLASMGIYVFNAATMEASLNNELTDFGKEIIPAAISRLKVNAYAFDGYWEDIGTIRNFYEANLELTTLKPRFDFYDENHPIYTHSRCLPPSKMNFSNMNQSIAAEGCIITNASITNSIVGVRTIIESGSSLNGVVCMGADFYESDIQKLHNAEARVPNVGIGRGTIVKRAIIDKNACIGEGCRIGVDDIARKDGNFGNYYVVDGIIVIPKNAVLYPGTVI